MSVDKRYELKEYYGNELFIQDNVNNKVQYYSLSKASLNKIVDRLNDQDNRIKELETRNKLQYDSLKKIYDLMYARDWKALDGIVEDWEESDRLLQEIHWCFEKRNPKW